MQAAAEYTPKCGETEAHYGPETRPRRRGEHPFACRQYASLVGMYEPIQTAYSTAHDTIQDPHCCKLSKDRKQTDCDLLHETAAATSARWCRGDEELCRTRRSRRHFERGGLLRTTKMRRKATSLCFGILVCWWSNFTGSTTAAVGATVPVNFGGGCPSACSGHGYCTNPRTETCSCHQGWAGGDCSIRKWRGIIVI